MNISLNVDFINHVLAGSVQHDFEILKDVEQIVLDIRDINIS